jgi:hypothetical protein
MLTINEVFASFENLVEERVDKEWLTQAKIRWMVRQKLLKPPIKHGNWNMYAEDTPEILRKIRNLQKGGLKSLKAIKDQLKREYPEKIVRYVIGHVAVEIASDLDKRKPFLIELIREFLDLDKNDSNIIPDKQVSEIFRYELAPGLSIIIDSNVGDAERKAIIYRNNLILQTAGLWNDKAINRGSE